MYSLSFYKEGLENSTIKESISATRYAVRTWRDVIEVIVGEDVFPVSGSKDHWQVGYATNMNGRTVDKFSIEKPNITEAGVPDSDGCLVR